MVDVAVTAVGVEEESGILGKLEKEDSKKPKTPVSY